MSLPAFYYKGMKSNLAHSIQAGISPMFGVQINFLSPKFSLQLFYCKWKKIISCVLTLHSCCGRFGVIL